MTSIAAGFPTEIERLTHIRKVTEVMAATNEQSSHTAHSDYLKGHCDGVATGFRTMAAILGELIEALTARDTNDEPADIIRPFAIGQIVIHGEDSNAMPRRGRVIAYHSDKVVYVVWARMRGADPGTDPAEVTHIDDLLSYAPVTDGT